MLSHVESIVFSDTIFKFMILQGKIKNWGC